MELTNLTANKVDSVIAEVLSKRGMNHLESLEDLKTKFDVRKPCIQYVCMYICVTNKHSHMSVLSLATSVCMLG